MTLKTVFMESSVLHSAALLFRALLYSEEQALLISLCIFFSPQLLLSAMYTSRLACKCMVPEIAGK